MATHRKNGSGSLLPKTTPPTPSIHIRQALGRLNHLDNLRIFLTSLVILHHTAIPYGGLGFSEFRSPCFPQLSFPLAAFNAIDQTFFMALFYWLAGYFSYLELGRRGTSWRARREFVGRRVRRLVVPSLFFTVFLEPVMHVMAMLRYCRLDPSACEYGISPVFLALETYVGYWSMLRGIRGPVWFCVLLAIFDAVAAIVSPSALSRLLRPFSPERLMGRKGFLTVFIPLFLLAFVVRLRYAVGVIWPLLNIQPAFLPQYIFAYLVGHAFAAAGDTNLRFAASDPYPHTYTNPYLNLVLGLAVHLWGLGMIVFSANCLKKPHEDVLGQVLGGWHFPSLMHVISNDMGFITIGPVLLDLFVRKFNFPVVLKLPWRKFTVANPTVKVVRYAFATFLVHPLVSLAVELAVEEVMGCKGVDSRIMYDSGDTAVPPMTTWSVLGPVVMTVVVGSLNVVLSWGVAMGLLDLVPELGRWV